MLAHESVKPAGVLRVEVLGARNLHAAVLGSLLKWTPSYSNPYVVVTLHQDEFQTSVKERALNPSWKETGELQVPLPTEQELLQSNGSGANAEHAKMNAMARKLTSSFTREREFHPCFPEMKIKVFHHSESPDGDHAGSVKLDDKLIGEVTVPVLPCIMSRSSSHRAWFTLTSDEHPEAGQIQLAMHYEVGGTEPMKGDIVRVAGFGGMDYYSKLFQANTRLEVVELYQDQVVCQCKSIEGWMLSFELHRNLLYVVRRPSILRDAHSQLQSQLSPVVRRAQSVWQYLPEGRRRQLLRLYQLATYSGNVVVDVVSESMDATKKYGLYAGLTSCVQGSGTAVKKVSSEVLRVYWKDPNARHPPTRSEELARYLEGGPLKARGRIVQAFGDAKVEDVVFLVPLAEGGDFEVEESKEDESDVEDELRRRSPLADCPEQLICPITGCPMMDPVVAADGHSYEREAIVQWFAASNISPMTGTKVPTTQVFPNFTLRKLSEEFQRTRRRY
ncbi:hypothetical protein Poli38472_003119 [Pythium oligandrum]|uniref:U-box domain-containing protein n=1 Tax=Pythium oligandrum TaxID=41045 RepID=A0A8K1FDR7_PYTOL|nr:hypothetical protein Poli38472_003119 [Pythium oligandrum]|eukprot:TMW57194.1 hypothetical protein Poli38472_003119 [Pythium oligandrum]